jgi:hypothetical protein
LSNSFCCCSLNDTAGRSNPAIRLSILAIMPSASAMSASVCLTSSSGIIETHQNTTCPKFYSAVFRLIKFISLSSF